MRLFLGAFFFETGLAKVGDLDTMTQRFIDWGIPAPAFNAALSGYTELIGGALIVLGLITRLTCVPMAVNMLVAVVTVKARGLSSLTDFVELDEPLYALAFVWLLFTGPGRVSLDRLIEQVWSTGQVAQPANFSAGIQ
jgi:putative oxidoreductase